MSSSESTRPGDRLLTARISASDALSRFPTTNGVRFVQLFRHGTLEVELYAPQDRDLQQPHRRDEVYVVVSGTGDFVHRDDSEVKRDRCRPGDFLFVPASIEHRFENFSSDFVVWVLFYGAVGGESTE